MTSRLRRALERVQDGYPACMACGRWDIPPAALATLEEAVEAVEAINAAFGREGVYFPDCDTADDHNAVGSALGKAWGLVNEEEETEA